MFVSAHPKKAGFLEVSKVEKDEERNVKEEATETMIKANDNTNVHV